MHDVDEQFDEKNYQRRYQEIELIFRAKSIFSACKQMSSSITFENHCQGVRDWDKKEIKIEDVQKDQDFVCQAQVLVRRALVTFQSVEHHKEVDNDFDAHDG